MMDRCRCVGRSALGSCQSWLGRAGLPWLALRLHFGHRMTLAGARRLGTTPDADPGRVEALDSG